MKHHWLSQHSVQAPGLRAIQPMLILLLAALATLGGASQAFAHEATPVPAAITTEQLGRADPADASGQALYLLRVTFAPGAKASAHRHPGTTIYHLDSGTLIFTLVGGQATLIRAGAPAAGTPTAGEQIAIGSPVILHSGDTIVYDGSTVQIEENPGAVPAVILLSNLRGADEPVRMPAPTATPAS